MPTSLDRYRLLGRSALRVSPLCLGTMTFGEEWGWGGSKEESKKQLDLYMSRGGNFIDTANLYTNGTSETFLGELLEGRREQVVLATKYTLCMRPGDPNAGGNHRKNMRHAVEASLKRLRTDLIDLYWVHAWDGVTAADEVMRGLDDLVRAGKVLHVGVSDFPAWKVSQANAIAELRGWSPFTALQVEWSLIERGVERDLVPMAIDLGIAVTPWSPLGGGVLTGKYTRGADEGQPRRYAVSEEWAKMKLTERNLAIARALDEVAAQVGRPAAQVAIAWLLGKRGCTCPIIGARTAKQLADSIAALEVTLAPEQAAKLDAASRIERGFPHDFLESETVRGILFGGTKIEGRGG
jgi:aryl-alcohol dehydrogenase-like predicted oxidoreductase